MITQQQKLLDKLRQGKVNSYYATYAMKIKQAPVRIKELKEQGYNIISIPMNDRSVDWQLITLSTGSTKPQNTTVDYVFIGNKAVRKEDIKPKQQILL